ncbi:hypothetical protein, partial [Pseudomonas fluorescens]
PGCPRIQACVRPAWFNGAPEIKIKSQIKIKIKSDSLRIVVRVERYVDACVDDGGSVTNT